MPLNFVHVKPEQGSDRYAEILARIWRDAGTLRIRGKIAIAVNPPGFWPHHLQRRVVTESDWRDTGVKRFPDCRRIVRAGPWLVRTTTRLPSVFSNATCRRSLRVPSDRKRRAPRCMFLEYCA